MDREQDIPFIYEDGVLKPQGPVNFPDGARGIAHIRETPNVPSSTPSHTPTHARSHAPDPIARHGPPGASASEMPATSPGDELGSGPEFWHNHSIDDLAHRQGTPRLAAPADLRGDWPADERLDDLLDDVRRGRH